MQPIPTTVVLHLRTMGGSVLADWSSLLVTQHTLLIVKPGIITEAKACHTRVSVKARPADLPCLGFTMGCWNSILTKLSSMSSYPVQLAKAIKHQWKQSATTIQTLIYCIWLGSHTNFKCSLQNQSIVVSSHIVKYCLILCLIFIWFFFITKKNGHNEFRKQTCEVLKYLWMASDSTYPLATP